MKVNLEITDTFSGEANYSWVNRKTYEFDKETAPSKLAIVRLVKKFAGLTGVRCEVENYGDQIVIRPVNQCIVCFVNIEY